MSLKDINLKPVYNSDESDLLSEFYIPLLSNSIKYDRIAGFFCSNSLAISAKGIANLINKGGRIRLIANVVISLEDQEAIKEALREKERELLLEIDSLEDQLQTDHIRMLEWMVKKRFLEIKIAVVPKGIEHQKVGIVYDEEGNTVSFSGSENETIGGWLNNDEQFHVFCSWNEGDIAHLNPDIDRFNKLWNDRGNKVRVYDISEAFNKGLIRRAPRDNEEFKRLTKRLVEELVNRRQINSLVVTPNLKNVQLFYYQKESIDNWFKNKNVGFLEMATGTGKTITAIFAIKKMIEDQPALGIIIVVPTDPLITQWKKELTEIGFDSSLIVCCSSNYNWLKTFNRYTLTNSKDNRIFIFTYQSLANENVQDTIECSQKDFLIICDEMHHAGAPIFSKCLNKNIKYRLGLSATPIRKYDIEGNSLLLKFFGKEPLLVFDIKRALTEVNPITGKTYLCPYSYNFKSVELTDVEHEEYRRLSRNIFLQKKNKNEEGQADKLRALVVSCASEKIGLLNRLLNNLKKEGKNKKILVYSQSFKSKDLGEKQIESVKRVFEQNGLNYLEFTSKFDDPIYRETILNALRIDAVDSIISIKCLDEGINLPEVRIAIILASSSNSAQFIQRRGRLLRNAYGKTKADIFDFIVGPPKGTDLKPSDISLIRREYDRAKEYSQYSLESAQNEQSLNNWLNSYNLTVEDLYGDASKGG